MGLLKLGGQILTIVGVGIMFSPTFAILTKLFTEFIGTNEGQVLMIYALPFFATGAIVLFLGLFMIALEKW